GAPGTTGSAGGATAEASGIPASGRGGADAAPEGATGVCAQPSTPRDHSTAARADPICPPCLTTAPGRNRPLPPCSALMGPEPVDCGQPHPGRLGPHRFSEYLAMA